MIEKAELNAKKNGYSNVEFRLGEIENLPVESNSVDVVISNCVINLSPDKKQVFKEAYRTLKTGGRIVISDIVLLKELPDYIKDSVEAYVGCISGAIFKDKYIKLIEEAGFQEIWKLFKETDKKFQDTDKKFQDTDKKLQETDNRVNALTGKWSRFVEGLIAPVAEKLFKERGIEVDRIYQRVKAHKNGNSIEIDILVVNGEYAVLIEAKSTLGVDDIKDHLERLGKFKFLFPEYNDRMVLGAVAGIVIDEGADKFAYRNGLFVIGQSGDAVKILNDDQFQPKKW